MMNEKKSTESVLSVLSLEDSVRDFEIIREQLIDSGYHLNISRVEKESEFTSFLRSNKCDVILADFSLPGFNAFGALWLCSQICPNVPFICVSGAIGEETAIELLKHGAVDYVMKDKLERLPIVIERALDEAKEKEARKKAEKALRETNDKLIRAQHLAHIGNWENYLPTNELFWSDEMYKILGFPPNTPLILADVIRIFPSDQLERFQQAVNNSINENAHYSMDYNIVRLDGSVRYIHDEGEVIRDEHGKPAWMIGTTQDITQRKLAEEKLQKSEERFRTLVENAFDGIYLTNGKNFYFVNNRFCEILGYSARELTSSDFNINETMTDGSIALEHERTILRSMNKKVPGTYEIQIKTKNGSLKNVEISTVNLDLGKDVSIMGIVRDITERKKIESQIIQSERLSALGEMSAGMAHEINQPLNTLSILFDNILLEARKNHSVTEEYLALKTEKVFNNILRIKNLIDHVREFSRSHEGYILSLFNINESILNALSMVAEQSKIAGIDIITSLDEKIPDIKGNTFKFEQVILNFVSNSKDALLEKKNRLNEMYPMFIKISTRFDKQNIYLNLEDNGIGIKEEIIDKILQPFFTTKETGKGTGLGLSISYGLIQEIHGKIAINSKVMIGTTILVTIPVKPGKI